MFCSDLTNESQEQYRTGTLLQSGAIAFCRYYNCLNEPLLVMLQTVLVSVWQTTMTNFLICCFQITSMHLILSLYTYCSLMCVPPLPLFNSPVPPL